MNHDESLSFLPFMRASLGSWEKNWIWSYQGNLWRSNLWLITHLLTYSLSVASISFPKRKLSQFLSLKTSRRSILFPCLYHLVSELWLLKVKVWLFVFYVPILLFNFSSSCSSVCVHLIFFSIPFCFIFFLSCFIFLLWFLVLVLCLFPSLRDLCVQHQTLIWILSSILKNTKKERNLYRKIKFLIQKREWKKKLWKTKFLKSSRVQP